MIYGLTSSTCDRWNADFFLINFVNVQYSSKFLSKKKWCMGKTIDETKLNWDDLLNLLKHQILVFLLRIKNTAKNLTIFFFFFQIQSAYPSMKKNYIENNTHMSPRTRKPTICICIIKDADQLCSTAQLISSFVFATRTVPSLFFLNPKSQASSLLL